MSRILAVDDTRSLLNMLKACLERGGHEVFTAKDGVEALEKLREHEPDLVITDLNMPEMNGLQLMAALNKENLLCPTWVLISTNKNILSSFGSIIVILSRGRKH